MRLTHLVLASALAIGCLPNTTAAEPASGFARLLQRDATSGGNRLWSGILRALRPAPVDVARRTRPSAAVGLGPTVISAVGGQRVRVFPDRAPGVEDPLFRENPEAGHDPGLALDLAGRMTLGGQYSVATYDFFGGTTDRALQVGLAVDVGDRLQGVLGYSARSRDAAPMPGWDDPANQLGQRSWVAGLSLRF